MVGNKSDREEEREVEWTEASRWAAENGSFAGQRHLPAIHTSVPRRSFPRSIIFFR